MIAVVQKGIFEIPAPAATGTFLFYKTNYHHCQNNIRIYSISNKGAVRPTSGRASQAN